MVNQSRLRQSFFLLSPSNLQHLSFLRCSTEYDEDAPLCSNLVTLIFYGVIYLLGHEAIELMMSKNFVVTKLKNHSTFLCHVQLDTFQ
jgi:hypothetical protein